MHIKNTRTGKTAQLHLSPKILELLPSLSAQSNTIAEEKRVYNGQSQAGDDNVENLARKIAIMPEKEILVFIE